MTDKHYDLEKFDRKIQKYMDGKRYLHTQGVRYTAAALAMACGEDIHKAETAGLLHDCAKKIPDEEKIELCQKNQIEITSCEKRNPFLLHTKLGAFLAEEKYGVKDPEILNAIRYHTTGRADMTKLEQIVFIADYIEPRRDKSQRLPQLRREAFRDLDECTYLELLDMLEYLGKRSGEIDDATKEAFAYYEKIHNKKGKTD